ncbi:MAG TPA: cellulase family glycosylhydrolase [Phototrophicaceae bacterium]|nr:cellulase family glycosylhydrolase [Phototrophicaceae bacterium]
MPAQTVLPRWRGFNLLPLFERDHFQNLSETVFRAEVASDLQWLADWGFDFARIPMDFRIWTQSDDLLAVSESVLEQIDYIVEQGQKYGVHICLNFHAAPGYCINPKPTLLPSLWKNQSALDVFAAHWGIFARRYTGIPAQQLSFDLVNEPPNVSDDIMSEADYVRVHTAAANAIHAVDPERLVIADGMNIGNTPNPHLPPDIAQSCRGYIPGSISHYLAPWANGMGYPRPTWPEFAQAGLDDPWNRERLETHYQQWANLAAQGVGIHCGEMGAYHFTPHTVALRWLEDVLDILKGQNIGFALWNFRGDFGVLDSGRQDVAYADFRGHQLDQALLDLLRRY